MKKAIVYAEVNPNIIDGSSIWMVSISQLLSRIFDEVHVQLCYPLENDLLVAPLKDSSRISLHTPKRSLKGAPGVKQIEKLIRSTQADVVIARGLSLNYALSKSSHIAPLLWSYVTDVPFPIDKINENALRNLRAVASRVHHMFAQTEGTRSYLEGICPEAAGKVHLMHPMIPDETFDVLPAKTDPLLNPDGSFARPLRLIYSGKFDREWKTLELLDIPLELERIGIPVELTVVGGKFGASRIQPRWARLMKSRLEEASLDPTIPVKWVGAVPREESIKLIKQADLGIGWRTRLLDSSLEISTKALEYSASGVPSLNNINRDNVQFFGADYPLFVDCNATAYDAARVIANAIPVLAELQPKVKNAATNYSMTAAENRLRNYFNRARVFEEAAGSKTRLLVVSHDLKFFGECLEHFRNHPGIDLKLDMLPDLHKQNIKQSKRLLKWADVVLVEFAGPALVWYSRNIGPKQRLYSRAHGFEIRRGRWFRNIDFDKVDSLILVSQRYREMTQLKYLEFDDANTTVIPNMVDAEDFRRPKVDNAQYVLGLAGIVPFLKRPDRAISLLKTLVSRDERYVLRIRGRAPWEYPWYWNNPVEHAAYIEFYRSIVEAGLQDHVVFDGFGPDMASWLRNIGFVLSPSSEESFHLAPAEGMASGAIPIVWDREGAREIFSDENVYSSVTDMAERVISLQDAEEFSRASQRARDYASRWDVPFVLQQWDDLILRNEK